MKLRVSVRRVEEPPNWTSNAVHIIYEYNRRAYLTLKLNAGNMIEIFSFFSSRVMYFMMQLIGTCTVWLIVDCQWRGWFYSLSWVSLVHSEYI